VPALVLVVREVAERLPALEQRQRPVPGNNETHARNTQVLKYNKILHDSKSSKTNQNRRLQNK
jgi:hypothetical protein